MRILPSNDGSSDDNDDQHDEEKVSLLNSCLRRRDIRVEKLINVS